MQLILKGYTKGSYVIPINSGLHVPYSESELEQYYRSQPNLFATVTKLCLLVDNCYTDGRISDKIIAAIRQMTSLKEIFIQRINSRRASRQTHGRLGSSDFVVSLSEISRCTPRSMLKRQFRIEVIFKGIVILRHRKAKGHEVEHGNEL